MANKSDSCACIGQSHAGTLYPDDPTLLTTLITAAIKENGWKSTPVRLLRELPAVMVIPLGSYIHTLSVMAQAFASTARLNPQLIVVAATMSRPPFDTIEAKHLFVPASSSFRTVLGTIGISTGLFGSLDSGFHAEDAYFREESSIETVLPFIQLCFPDCPVMPVLCDSASRATETVSALADLSVLSRIRLLVICRADLSPAESWPAGLQESVPWRMIEGGPIPERIVSDMVMKHPHHGMPKTWYAGAVKELVR